MAQIADFLLPTEGVEIVVCYGIRRGKIILSVRSSNDEIHVGRVLSKRFPEGLAGGHKSLAGGQIPIELLIDQDNINDKTSQIAMEKMSDIIHELFG